jgi:hypothetical protein
MPIKWRILLPRIERENANGDSADSVSRFWTPRMIQLDSFKSPRPDAIRWQKLAGIPERAYNKC